MTEKKRTDIYNAKAIAEKLGGNNPKQKVSSLFLGTNFYSTNKDIDALIKVLNEAHKQKIAELKALKHKS